MAKLDSPSLTLLWIGVGGGLGSMARHLASGWVARHWGATFPWGTLLVNVTGSLVIGLFAALTAPEGRWLVPATGRQFFMIGVLGGYTTFSSFSLQTLNLVEEGEWFRAGANAVLSLVLCMLGVWLGHAIALAVNTTKGS